MDTTNFNLAIKDFFRTKYNIDYNKDIQITYEKDKNLFTFVCKMIFNQEDRPMTIMGQYATLEEFTKYVLTDLESRGLPLGVKYFILIQTDSVKE